MFKRIWMPLLSIIGLSCCFCLSGCQSRATAETSTVVPRPRVFTPQSFATTAEPSHITTPAAARMTLPPPRVHAYRLFQHYTIAIPDATQIRSIGPNAAVAQMVYLLTAPNGETATVTQHSYMDGAGSCGPVHPADPLSVVECEGMVLTQTVQLPSEFLIAAGSRSIDLAYQCTMNAPCPLDIPPEQRYINDYVFVVIDRREMSVLEWFIGGVATQRADERGIVDIVRTTILPSVRR